MRDATSIHICQQLDSDVIESSTKFWSSPVFLVPKKECSACFCVEYRRLNAATVPYTYPLPCMDYLLDTLVDSKVFTTLDSKCGYCQIPVVKEDQYKAYFITHMGTYR